MLIPRHVYSTTLAPRQAVLPTEFATTNENAKETSAADSDGVDRTSTTIRTTTIAGTRSSSASSTATDTSILAQAKATTTLSWWQLLCIAMGGVLLLSILLWAIWRTTRRKSKERKRAKEVEAEEEQRVKEILEQRRANEGRRDRHRRKGIGSTLSGGSSEYASSEESYDSVSDGGTIVTRRRRTRRRRRDKSRKRGRGRKRYDDYSSEESEWSDETRYDHRGRRDRYHGRERDRHHRRRSFTPTPSPPPVPEAHKKGFRDSVFSTYASMKKAAVQLKVVEAKVKLRQQLEQEERIERARQDKIRRKVVEANREIERYNQAPSAGSDRPLIPPAPDRKSSVASSFPTPRPRSARRGSSLNSATHIPPRPIRKQSNSPQQAVQSQMVAPGLAAPLKPPDDPKPPQTGFGAEIQILLGRKPPAQAAQSASRQLTVNATKPARPKVKKQPTNDFQADWLSHPNPAMSVPQSPSHSVYVPVTQAKDWPMIPPGGLAPVPPPKARMKAVAGMGTVNVGLSARGGAGIMGSGQDGGIVARPGAGAGKWADRLRARK